jgi:hypothetical protein
VVEVKTFRRPELALPLLEIERELAKQRQIELGKTHGKTPLASIEAKGRGARQQRW